ncbi:MAG: four helix bundle protein [Candidatus Methylomirabilaceae bacterium]
MGTRGQEAKGATSDGRRDIQARTFSFALSIVRLCRQLDGAPGVRRILAAQLLRSGTSVGANVEEAQAAQSRADFISKYSIALKEARESRYWLRIMSESQLIDRPIIIPLLQESSELSRILGAIVSRAKRRAVS